MTGNSEPRGELTVRTIAMPADTNANGDIFGGWVMSQMDQAGGIAGVERAQVERIGRTSMTIQVEAWARRFQTRLREKVTDATFTFVAIDQDGRPRPIPPAAEPAPAL
jgi:acyl-CoA thioesterase YciA